MMSATARDAVREDYSHVSAAIARRDLFSSLEIAEVIRVYLVIRSILMLAVSVQKSLQLNQRHFSQWMRPHCQIISQEVLLILKFVHSSGVSQLDRNEIGKLSEIERQRIARDMVRVLQHIETRMRNISGSLCTLQAYVTQSLQREFVEQLLAQYTKVEFLLSQLTQPH